MVQNPPEGCQRIIPYLTYADGRAAVDYLTSTFGFEERFVMAGPDGSVMHAELGLVDSIVMVGTPAEGSQDGQVGQRSLVVCYVDDVDAHFAHAKASGAEILAAPEDQFYGDRTYRARDPEGHQWYFHTHVRDVAPEDMKPA